jgi:hypothetical protein
MPRFDLNHDDDRFDDPEAVDDDSTSYEPSSTGGRPPVSGKAIASLIFAAMFCIPMIPSLLAALFGFASLREIRRGYRSGRGYGLTGLILGLIGIGGWLLLGATIYVGIHETDRAKEVATTFLHELSEGKLDEALARAVEGTPKEPLAATVKAMTDWGKFDTLSVNLRSIEPRKEGFRLEFDGIAGFARADQDVNIQLSFDGSSYRVERFQIAGKYGVGGGQWGAGK